jgi:hypothetical protein
MHMGAYYLGVSAGIRIVLLVGGLIAIGEGVVLLHERNTAASVSKRVRSMGYGGNYFFELFRGWVALMSIATLFLLFLPVLFPATFTDASKIPASYLWLGSAICFAVANFAIWRREKVKHEAAPHMDICVLNVVPHGRAGRGLTDLFLHVRLILAEPSYISIQDFTLQISNETTSLTANEVGDVNNWEVVQPVGSYTRSVCTPLTKELTRRGDPVQGWVHLKIPDLSESAVMRCTLIFKVNCVHGTCYSNLPGNCAFPDVERNGTMRKLPL